METHDEDDLFLTDDLILQAEDTTEDSHSVSATEVYESITDEEWNFLAACDSCGEFI